MFDKLLSPETIEETLRIVQNEFPLAIWETIYVTLIATAFAIVIGLPPVSYTHLDVYKRQRPHHAKLSVPAFRRHAPEGGNRHGYDLSAEASAGG